MNFSDTKQESKFRVDCAAWLKSSLKDFDPSAEQSIVEEQSRWWQECLYAGGWAGLSWAEEYGGRGLDIVFEAIFNQEAAIQGAPIPINMMAMSLTGPTIIAYGSPFHKERYLKKILTGEEVWCQGFSEPGSGSDLASLTTKAIKTKTGWLINGQKVWTSNGHLAQKCMLLARSSPEKKKHAGITYFLADTKDFEIRPLKMINGDSEFNEMFLDNVLVDTKEVIGGEDNGWNVALATLSFERSSLGFTLQVWARQLLDRLIRLVKVKGLETDSGVLEMIGEFEAKVDSIKIAAIRVMSSISDGEMPGPESSTLKLVWSSVIQDMGRFALIIGGEEFIYPKNAEDALWMHKYLRSRGNSIEGGTSEIQKSIIAERVLGLPKSR